MDLEECLGMCTYRANLGSLLALVDVAAVGALPYNLLALGKYFALLYISQQLEVTSLMLLLDQTNLLEQESNLGEALFLSLSSELGILQLSQDM